MDQTLALHVSPEFDEHVKRSWNIEKNKPQYYETFLRRRLLEALENRAVDYSVWLLKGRKVSFTYRKNGRLVTESEVIDEDEPGGFQSLHDDKPSKFETVTFEVKVPEFMVRKILGASAYENAANRWLNEHDKESPARTVFSTAGEWVKQCLLLPAFPLDIKSDFENLDEFERSESPALKKKQTPGTG